MTLPPSSPLPEQKENVLKRFRKALVVVAAVTALATAAVVAHSSTGTAQPLLPAQHGIAHLATQVDLPPGTWTDTPLTITLYWPGTYALDADVRARLTGTPMVNTYISARLWNETSGVVVPQSERLIYQVHDANAGDATTGGHQTAPISELIRVDGPTTIRLQARRSDATGSANLAEIYSGTGGHTSLRYVRLP